MPFTVHYFVTACFVWASAFGRSSVSAFVQCPPSYEKNQPKDYKYQCADGKAANYTGKFFHCCRGSVDLVTRECHGYCRGIGVHPNGKPLLLSPVKKRDVTNYMPNLLDQSYYEVYREMSTDKDYLEEYGSEEDKYSNFKRKAPYAARKRPPWRRGRIENVPSYRRHHRLPEEYDMRLRRRMQHFEEPTYYRRHYGNYRRFGDYMEPYPDNYNERPLRYAPLNPVVDTTTDQSYMLQMPTQSLEPILSPKDGLFDEWYSGILDFCEKIGIISYG